MKLFAAVGLSFFLCIFARAESITVSAAVSLQDVLTEIGKTYQSQTGDTVRFNFAASGPLQAQIQQGAPVDCFISAANKQLDELIKAHLADPSSRRVIVRNEIVLIAPASSTNPPRDFADLTALRIMKIALGQPRSVPAGQYAMQTLTALKLADALVPRFIFGVSVRQVLDYVQRNEADAGIVYMTDVRQAGSAVKIIQIAPPNTHEPIEYPGAIITASPRAPAARRFLQFLSTPPARAVFSAAGFIIPDAAPSTQPAP